MRKSVYPTQAAATQVSRPAQGHHGSQLSAACQELKTPSMHLRARLGQSRA